MHATVDIDFYYRREACAICRCAGHYLDAYGVRIRSVGDADREPLGPDDALDLAGRAEDQILVARGPQLIRFDKRARAPTRRQLLDVILAPSGNLRAPTLLVGHTLVVGFHERAYSDVLASSRR